MKSILAITTAVLAAAHLPLALAKYPANVEIDLVFPQNGTYNIGADFPVVFAIQNADPFITWKPYFSWEVRAANDTTGEAAESRSMSLSRGLPSDIVHNMWWAAGSAGKSTKMAPGQYTLSWNLSIIACEQNGRLKFSKSKVFLNGTMKFATVTDGSGKDVDFTADCPLYQGTVYSGYADMDGANLLCPSVQVNTKAKTSPCRAKVWKSMEACINHNLTNFNTKDFAPCQKAIDDAPKDIGGGVSEDDKFGDEGTKNDTGSGEKKDEDGGAGANGVSMTLLGLSMAVVFGFAL